jgi:hypothetical protein
VLRLFGTSSAVLRIALLSVSPLRFLFFKSWVMGDVVIVDALLLFASLLL